MRYLNGTELVSASTDSTLRLWDTKACTAGRVFSGHNNEKNFVGLSVDGDFMACGSETNEVGMSWSLCVCAFHALISAKATASTVLARKWSWAALLCSKCQLWEA